MMNQTLLLLLGLFLLPFWLVGAVMCWEFLRNFKKDRARAEEERQEFEQKRKDFDARFQKNQEEFDEEWERMGEQLGRHRSARRMPKFNVK